MQERRNVIANALELRFSFTNLSRYIYMYVMKWDKMEMS